MLSVGVTGNIGSGKSTVCSIFQWMGVPIYEADLAVKRLYNQHTGLKKALVSLLGVDAYNSKGEFDTPWVRQRVFANDDLRSSLNALVHPIVFEDFANWCKEKEAENHQYIIKEAAILFESGANATVDLVIGVVAPMAVRKQRVLARDNMNEQEFERRVKAQWPQEEWMDRCDYIIQNNGESSLIKQVMEVHQGLTNR
jgi:dephospho-CoA kinase